MAREHHRDEHPGHLVDRVAGLPALVADRQQHVEELALAVGPGGAPLEHLGEQLHQPSARAVAAAEGGQRQVGVHVGDRIRPLLELVEDAVVLGRELLAKFGPDQARARGVEGELGEEVEQVDLPRVAQLLHHAAGLVGDRLGVTAHHLVAQRLVLHRLPTLLGVAVEEHTAPEHRRHEGIGGGLVELLLVGPEEGLLGPLTGEQHHPVAGEVHLADLAALAAHAREQLDRVLAQLEQVTEQRQVAREHGRGVAPAAARRRGSIVGGDRGGGLAHDYTFTGSAAKPRTLIECTRTAPSGSIS